MARRNHREATRMKPIGREGIEACRKIVEGDAPMCAKVNEVMVDSFSASVIVQVYDALNPDNRAKIERMPVMLAADICFKLCG